MPSDREVAESSRAWNKVNDALHNAAHLLAILLEADDLLKRREEWGAGPERIRAHAIGLMRQTSLLRNIEAAKEALIALSVDSK